MIAVNDLTTLDNPIGSVLQPTPTLLSHTPRTSRELWRRVPDLSWTTIGPLEQTHLMEDQITYPISFNGKVRFKLDLPASLTIRRRNRVRSDNEPLRNWAEKNHKVIVVPGRIVNVVM